MLIDPVIKKYKIWSNLLFNNCNTNVFKLVLFLLSRTYLFRIKNWNELKEVSSFLVKTSLKNSNKYLYDTLLSKYDDTVNSRVISDKVDVKFVGRGKGVSPSSLNTYRKISYRYRKKVLFEKVYNSSSIALKKNIWLENSNIKMVHRTPEIVYSDFGAKLSLLYFNYIDIEPVSCKEAVRISEEFTHHSIKNLRIKDKKEYLNKRYIYDYRYIPKYKEAEIIVYRSNILNGSDKSILFEISKHLIKTDICSFAHADLHPMNIGQQAIVDFDNCGYYSIGIDVAYTFTKCSYIEHYDIIEDYLEYLCNKYRLNVDEEKLFRLSFLYFSLLNLFRRLKPNKHIGETYLRHHTSRLVSYYKFKF